MCLQQERQQQQQNCMLTNIQQQQIKSFRTTFGENKIFIIIIYIDNMQYCFLFI